MCALEDTLNDDQKLITSLLSVQWNPCLELPLGQELEGETYGNTVYFFRVDTLKPTDSPPGDHVARVRVFREGIHTFEDEPEFRDHLASDLLRMINQRRARAALEGAARQFLGVGFVRPGFEGPEHGVCLSRVGTVHWKGTHQAGELDVRDLVRLHGEEMRRRKI